MPPPRKKKSFKEITHVTRERIAAALHSRFALRFHTSILLLWTFCAGLLTTKALFALGMQSMFWRYTIAIVVAYGAFLVGVRLWLHYVGAGAARKESNSRSLDRADGSLDIPDLSFPSGGGSPGGFSGGGGSSGGGGASGSFDAGVAPPPNQLVADSLQMPAVSGSGGGDSGIFGNVGGKVGDVVGDIGGGDGEGCLIAFAIIIVLGIIVLAIGAAFFIISMGPEILIEAAFNALLAGGLIKSGVKVSDPDWIGSVFKATWIPFGIVLVMAWIFTGIAAVLTPQAHTFGEVWRIVWPLLLSSI